MHVSKKKKKKIYNAIFDPVTELRIANSSGMSIEKMDEALFKLERSIRNNITTALNIS